jgi:hypothetical protein
MHRHYHQWQLSNRHSDRVDNYAISVYHARILVCSTVYRDDYKPLLSQNRCNHPRCCDDVLVIYIFIQLDNNHVSRNSRWQLTGWSHPMSHALIFIVVFVSHVLRDSSPNIAGIRGTIRK